MTFACRVRGGSWKRRGSLVFSFVACSERREPEKMLMDSLKVSVTARSGWQRQKRAFVVLARQRERSRTKDLPAVRTRRRCAHSDVGKLERLKDYRCILRLGF